MRKKQLGEVSRIPTSCFILCLLSVSSVERRFYLVFVDQMTGAMIFSIETFATDVARDVVTAFTLLAVSHHGGFVFVPSSTTSAVKHWSLAVNV